MAILGPKFRIFADYNLGLVQGVSGNNLLLFQSWGREQERVVGGEVEVSRAIQLTEVIGVDLHFFEVVNLIVEDKWIQVASDALLPSLVVQSVPPVNYLFDDLDGVFSQFFKKVLHILDELWRRFGDQIDHLLAFDHNFFLDKIRFFLILLPVPNQLE